MQGVLYKTQECTSKFGGQVYRNFVRCVDGEERILWADPKMENWRHWQEIVQISMNTKFRDKGLILSDLKVLRKDPRRLNADYPPEYLDICDLRDCGIKQ